MNLDKRQKIIVTLIIIVLAVLVWQGSKFFVTENNMSSFNNKLADSKSLLNKLSVINFGQKSTNQAADGLVEAAILNISSNKTNPNPNQQKYLELVAEYQMTQIKRMIAEDNEAIAVAHYNAAQALYKIGQLTSNFNIGRLSSVDDQNVSFTNDYELIYSGETNHQWTATLKKNSQLIDVTTGTVFPNGDKILLVDDKGVLIQQGKIQKLITFNGVKILTKDSEKNTGNQQNNLEHTVSPEKISNIIGNKEAVKATETTALPILGKDISIKQPTSLQSKQLNKLNDKNVNDSTEHSRATASTTKVTKPDNLSSAPVKNEASKTTPLTLTAAKIEATNTSSMLSSTPVPIALAKPADNINAVAGATVVMKAVNNSKQLSKISEQTLNNNKNVVKSVQAKEDVAKNIYTIQIIADKDLNAIETFISHNHLSNKTKVIKTQRNNQNWYIATYGQYSSIIEAQDALEDLPYAVRYWHPFIKNVNDIKTNS